MPEVSVITINRNNSGGLKCTIESVLKQSFSDVEYLVIDGASTDGSQDVIKQFDDGITWWISEPDTGVYNAMNKGIKKATGKFCLFLNSGDEFSDEKSLESLLNGRDDPDIIYGDIELTGKRINYPDKLSLYFLRWNSLPHPATLIKRDLFTKLGYYTESYRVASDWEFWMKAIIQQNCSYKHVAKLITRIEEPGLSANNQGDHTEGWSVLYSLFPKRILDDYDRFKEYESIVNDPVLNWVHKSARVYKVLSWFIKFYGK